MSFVSKKNIYRLLENYRAMLYGDQMTVEPGVSINTGPKSLDGVSGGRLNKIMLDQALSALRKGLPFSYRCIDAKYLRPILVRESTHMLGVKLSVYNRGIKEGVDFLYFQVNGKEANLDLLRKAIDRA